MVYLVKGKGKGLKDYPKPIVTFGQRKQKENQIRENPKQAKKTII